MSDLSNPEENGVLLAFVRRHLGENLTREESNHAFIVAGQNRERICKLVRQTEEMVAELRLGPVTTVAGMVFTENELELLRTAKADGNRSLADVFSQPPFVADGIRKMQAAMGEDATVVSVTDERVVLTAALLELIASHIHVELVGHGQALLTDAAAFRNLIAELRALATTVVRP